MHVVGPRGGTCGHHIYQIYASYLHVRILYEFLGTSQSLKVFGKFKNKSKCFWKPSSKFTIRNGYLVTVYKSGFEAHWVGGGSGERAYHHFLQTAESHHRDWEHSRTGSVHPNAGILSWCRPVQLSCVLVERRSTTVWTRRKQFGLELERRAFLLLHISDHDRPVR